MRLLNTQTLEFKEFLGDEKPSYVILSHRWSHDEVSHKEFRKRSKTSGIGYDKIVRACEVARTTAKLDWIWIDSCCIDKRSSAELSEAINSMWRWYEDAFICFVYLADVPAADFSTQAAKKRTMSDFRNSEWFLRGWTLQELLAPTQCDFWTAAWEPLGSRYTLREIITEVTGIPTIHLTNRRLLKDTCAAEKMHWASSRRTTRPEDTAYSLLGLFDINMPLLYGEGGPKAFGRLQVAIFDSTGDRSLFIWISSSSRSPFIGRRHLGVFSSEVTNFRETTQDYVEYDDFEETKIDEVTHRTQSRRITLELDVREYEVTYQMIYVSNQSVVVEKTMYMHRLPYVSRSLREIVFMIMKRASTGEWFIHRPSVEHEWADWMDLEVKRMGLRPTKTASNEETPVMRKAFTFLQLDDMR